MDVRHNEKIKRIKIEHDTNTSRHYNNPNWSFCGV